MSEPEIRESSLNNPLIWALYGARTGDNQQVSALAHALGGTVEEKFLDYSPLYGLPNFLIGATRSTVRKPARAQMNPPWPDIVIASGRRSVAPARWIKRQSGNRTKLVQLGRPRAALHIFDLVITTAQYGLPEADNVLSLSLPLQSAHQTEDQNSESPFTGLSQLPKPRTGLLVGGTTWPFIVDARAAAALASDINRWVGRFGGSVLITTSPRTGPEVAQTLGETIIVPHFLHRWTAGMENPYNAILQSADQLIVTSDSISMLADAIRSGKATAIWKTGLRADPLSTLCRTLGHQADRNTRLGDLLRFAARKGLFSPPRLVERITDAITASRRAGWFDPDNEIARTPPSSEDDDMRLAIARVRSLVD